MNKGSVILRLVQFISSLMTFLPTARFSFCMCHFVSITSLLLEDLPCCDLSNVQVSLSCDCKWVGVFLLLFLLPWQKQPTQLTWHLTRIACVHHSRCLHVCFKVFLFVLFLLERQHEDMLSENDFEINLWCINTVLQMQQYLLCSE